MKKAVLIIAHGSSNKEWIEKVDNQVAIAKVNTRLPIFVSFLENANGRELHDAVSNLDNQNVKKILVIPLFISSASNHFDNLKQELLKYKERFLFSFSSCIDDDDLAVEHIIKQASIISKNPKEEDILIIAHGSNDIERYKLWQRTLLNLVEKIKYQTNYHSVNYATFLPYTIDKQLRIHRGKATSLIIPFFLSRGIFTEKRIPNAVKQFTVRYLGTTFIEEDWISHWLEKKIKAFS